MENDTTFRTRFLRCWKSANASLMSGNFSDCIVHQTSAVQELLNERKELSPENSSTTVTKLQSKLKLKDNQLQLLQSQLNDSEQFGNQFRSTCTDLGVWKDSLPLAQNLTGLKDLALHLTEMLEKKCTEMSELSAAVKDKQVEVQILQRENLKLRELGDLLADVEEAISQKEIEFKCLDTKLKNKEQIILGLEQKLEEQDLLLAKLNQKKVSDKKEVVQVFQNAENLIQETTAALGHLLQENAALKAALHSRRAPHSVPLPLSGKMMESAFSSSSDLELLDGTSAMQSEEKCADEDSLTLDNPDCETVLPNSQLHVLVSPVLRDGSNKKEMKALAFSR